ncbi:MAG: hypothetical protein EP320_00585 [Rhodobacteraceae bacterium]|nr:MAG: hypothetical protein EP320_00585 [Paracoccaceae bacterium]
MTITDLYQMPFELIWMLVVGYIGYRLAYVGRDAPHKTFDQVFLVFVFGSIGRGCGALVASWWDIGDMIESAIALIAGVVVALIWRRWGQAGAFNTLRAAKMVNDDGQANVWHSMLARQLKPPRRLVVKLRNGASLMCNHLADFGHAPMGPCLLGSDGSVALYITDFIGPGEEEWTQVEPYDPTRPDWGYEISFIPADQIARIDLTYPA